jgi:hypothetical protein
MLWSTISMNSITLDHGQFHLKIKVSLPKDHFLVHKLHWNKGEKKDLRLFVSLWYKDKSNNNWK